MLKNQPVLALSLLIVCSWLQFSQERQKKRKQRWTFHRHRAWMGTEAKPAWFQFCSLKARSRRKPESRTQTATGYDFTTEVSALKAKSGGTMWRVLLRNVSYCGEIHSLSFFFFNGEQKTGRESRQKHEPSWWHFPLHRGNRK